MRETPTWLLSVDIAGVETRKPFVQTLKMRQKNWKRELDVCDAPMLCKQSD